jgi:hypothetical protein
VPAAALSRGTTVQPGRPTGAASVKPELSIVLPMIVLRSSDTPSAVLISATQRGFDSYRFMSVSWTWGLALWTRFTVLWTYSM